MKLSNYKLRKIILESISEALALVEKKSKKKIDYKKAYKKYHSSKKAKKERALRNRMGRKLKKAGVKIPKNHDKSIAGIMI